MRELSKSSYDHITQPPAWDELTHIRKSLPKNFDTVSLEEVADRVFDNFCKFDPLVLKLSKENAKLFKSSVLMVYGMTNFKDLDEGGTGMIIPTFLEVMRCYYVRITHHEKKQLTTNEDRQFYSKYKWAWDQYCLLSYDDPEKKVS